MVWQGPRPLPDSSSSSSSLEELQGTKSLAIEGADGVRCPPWSAFRASSWNPPVDKGSSHPCTWRSCLLIPGSPLEPPGGHVARADWGELADGSVVCVWGGGGWRGLERRELA